MAGAPAHRRAMSAPRPGTVIVTLPEEIDITNDGQVQDILARALSDRTAVLVADGSGTSFCGRSGVAALLSAHRRAATAGTQLRVAASPALRRILELTGADHRLDTYPTLATALAGPEKLPA